MCLICSKGTEVIRAEDTYIKLFYCSVCRDVRVVNKFLTIPFSAEPITTISSPKIQVTIKEMLQTKLTRGKTYDGL